MPRQSIVDILGAQSAREAYNVGYPMPRQPLFRIRVIFQPGISYLQM